MNSIIQKAPVLHRFVERLLSKNLNDDVTFRQAKRVIADTVGVAYSGIKTSAFASAFKSKQDFFGEGNLPIWGTEKTSNLLGAVFYNALSVSSTDFDEGHRKAAGHPASLVVPVALMLGNHLGKSYDDILKSVIIGYETGTRFSFARFPEKVDTYSSGKWGTLAAAATAAYLLELDTEKFMHGLSLAYVLSPTMQGGSTDVSTGSMSKEGVAWAAQSGLQSAMLAKDNFVGPYLFIDAYDDIDPTKLMPGKEENWLINSNYFKPFACCRWLHTAINLAQEIKSSYSLNVDDIENIDVAIFSRAKDLIESKYPQNTVQAQFHLPFTIACMLLFDEVTPDLITETNLLNADIKAIIDKIRLTPSDSYDNIFPSKLGSKITIELKDGKVLSRESTEAPWDSIAPPSDDDLFRKFESQVGMRANSLWEKYLQSV